jgi:hypothetical protein
MTGHRSRGSVLETTGNNSGYQRRQVTAAGVGIRDDRSQEQVSILETTGNRSTGAGIRDNR